MKQNQYSWNADDYTKNSSAQYEWAQELIGKLNLNGTESVLDIGCGDGKVTALIGSYLNQGSVTGIDNSVDMIETAKKSFPSAKHPNVSFLVLDAAKLNCDNRFDVAFSNAVLHWVKDHKSVLRGVQRSLKKSGRILFQMGGKGNAQDIVDTLDELIKTEKWRPYFIDFSFPYFFYSPDEYTPWFKEAGLIAKRVELITKDMVQKGKEGLAGWIRTTWMPYIQRVPGNKRESLIDDIVSLYSKKFPIDASGMLHVKMVRLEVEAIKS